MHSGKRWLDRVAKVSILVMGLAALPIQTFSADSAPATDVPPELRLVINRAIGSDQDAYHFRGSGAGCFEARYPALGADVRVGPKGLTVRTGAGAWTLGASAPMVSGAAPGLPRQTAPNRVEVDRGWAIEWVVNGPSGLEQGWDIPKRPSWAAEGGALLIPLEQNDALRAVSVEADGRAIDVRDAQGRDILRYAGLRVTDAAGRELPARFETRAGDGALWIKVADTGAAYPIVVDPWVESAKLVASDKQQDDHLGCSIALSANGRICAVGARNASPGGMSQAGAVYIFTNAAGSWSGVMNQATKLVASDRQASDNLGWSVALSADGGICAAGAYGSSPDGMSQAGAVYLFTNAAGSWSGVTNQTAKLVASDKQQTDRLGCSVALSSNGSICAVGAYSSSPGGVSQAGAVYLFTNVAGSWSGVTTQTTTLVASDMQLSDCLGTSVALSADGGICAAGAYGSSPGGTNMAGAVYIFTNAAGSWSGVTNQASKLFASDRHVGDYLGSSVALNADGGICAAGAPNASPDGLSQAGAVYIFTNATGSWSGVATQTTKLIASDRQALDSFGSSVALSANGRSCAAGAPNASPSGSNCAGAVYIFTNAAGSWSGVATQTTKLVASDKQAFDNFGSSVALSADGGTCIAGAEGSSPGATNHAGAAYVNVLPVTYGWLSVVILPASAVAANAHWRVDGGAWQVSGTILTNLSAGEHSISYSAVTNYTAPTNQTTVTIVANQLSAVRGDYSQDSRYRCRMPICADYDGDHKADPALFLAAAISEEYLIYGAVLWSSANNYTYISRPLGLDYINNYINIPTVIAADFDGDGTGDLGCYNTTNGHWFALLSTLQYQRQDMEGPFGNEFYTALAADFDGDHKADPTLYNPVTGDWLIKASAFGYATFTFAHLLGGTGFAAGAADLDGDQLADPFVCNMTTGQCIAMFSSFQYYRITTPEGYLGTPGCILALADYDGDGLADPAVFNPGNLVNMSLTARLSSNQLQPTTVQVRFPW